MEFRILGPLEVLEDGRQVELGGAKQRALLATLLLRANQVVSTDRLIDALWEDEAPDTGRKALQVYVSQLRKVLGRERLQTKAPGYLLRVEPSELDLERFQGLVASGQLGDALSLWRGPALSEFAYQRFAQTEIARLEELRLACLEDRIDADLAAARHAALVGELEALVTEHPLRERLRGQLMLALYRSARQAEALEIYQAGRRILTEELGLEPGQTLKELQLAILAHDPALELAPEAEQAEQPAREAVPPRSAPGRIGREVRKTVTVLFADVAGSTELGERLDPESLRRVMGRYFQEMSAVLEGHGATVEKFIGDAVMAVFGVPAVHEDDPLRAVRAAVEMRERLATLNEELERQWGVRLVIRIGLNTGEVVAGGTDAPTYATGDAVNVAARLQQEASPGEILLGRETYRFVRDIVLAEPVEPLAVKGKSTAVETVRLLAVTADAARDVRRSSSPMVGRERERRRLYDAFEQAVGDRSCQLFTILGAAGVGKSRLVQEFLVDLGDRALVARGRCLPYGEGITYWPLIEVVREIAGLDDAESPDESRLKLAQLLEDADHSRLVIQRVAELTGLAETVAAAEESFSAVRTFFETLARGGPLVLVFDDVHWGEATFLDLLESIADWSRDAPILLVCVGRPELLDVRAVWGGGKLNSTSVLLEPLSDEQCAVLIGNLLGEAELPSAAQTRITEAAEGNPLFVEEMLSMLIDDGLLVRRDGHWAATEDLSSVRVPQSIQALLTARLDRLGDDERVAIERASVEGKLFHEGWVAEQWPEAVRASVPEHLATLVRKELIRPGRAQFSGEHAYRFRHLLIRDAAYESIPKRARATHHERYAEWLEQRAAERPIEYEEILGYHLEQAFRYRSELGPLDDEGRALGRRAAERLGRAGRRAFLRSDAPAGVNLISRAVALLPAHDPLRVELVPNVRVVQGIPDLSWADRVLTEAVEAAATTGDRRLAAHALVQRGLLRLFTDSDVTPQELFDVSDRAIAVFEEMGDELGLARACRLVAQAHYLDRRIGSCADASERALRHARLASDAFEEREIVEWLVIALLLGPTPAEDAISRCRGLLAETAGHAPLQAQVLGALAHLVAMQGCTTEADELIARSRGLMAETGEWIWIESFWLALVHMWRGDGIAAEQELRPGYDALKKIGEKSHFSSISHALSNALYVQRRDDEAERLTRECEEACRANDVHSQILWRSIRAKIFARRRAFDEAERLAREALELAETSDFLLAHADALADLAEVLDLADRREEAALALENAIDLYERKGNLLAANSGRARLASLI